VWNIKWNMLSNDVSMTHIYVVCAGITLPVALRKKMRILMAAISVHVIDNDLSCLCHYKPHTVCDCGQHSLWNVDLQKWWQTWINEIDFNRSLNQVSPFMVCEYVTTCYLVCAFVRFGIGQISYSRMCNLHAWHASVTTCWTTLVCLMWGIVHLLPEW
jgi:hypothetical protein